MQNYNIKIWLPICLERWDGIDGFRPVVRVRDWKSMIAGDLETCETLRLSLPVVNANGGTYILTAAYYAFLSLPHSPLRSEDDQPRD